MDTWDSFDKMINAALYDTGSEAYTRRPWNLGLQYELCARRLELAGRENGDGTPRRCETQYPDTIRMKYYVR